MTAHRPIDDEALPILVVDRRPGAPLVRPRWRRALGALRIVPLIWLIFAAGAFVGLYVQPPGLRLAMKALGLQPGGGTRDPIAVPVQRAPPRQNAAPITRQVVALGRLLPENDVVVVAPPYGAGDARIAALRVAEGDTVRRGDELAVLDNEAPLRAALEAARATVGVREAALAQTRATVTASRDEARAALARAQSAAQNAEREFDRAEELRRRGIVADAAYDQRRAARDQALREVEAARATLSRFERVDDAAQPDILVAMRNLDAARAELARAERDLDRGVIRAPADGTVLTIHVRPGEKPGAKGVMNLGDLSRMTAELEVYQTRIGQVDVGGPVTVTADALPEALGGRVSRIGLEVGRQTATDTSPAANTDARVVKVHVRLDPASSEVARRYTNLQVTGRIQVGGAP
ncbi:HlyD family efflux transporter periplasmic adaptor subunit [Salinarimonas soli]|uniref:HlyD family efflux transporter periplasmic adaptor subunit n=1 Tax=Salinarimonas soli TaxID=1638099 RepID=A0A5B2VZ20_9HYPH|nr:HlyD family efflux transporter periplasmic adaptor subunit [Salinarimonas soli]KAA2244034.1 HlyD family efflux transporter periplasmic adaptor subunit [Salinarimonas soli]